MCNSCRVLRFVYFVVSIEFVGVIKFVVIVGFVLILCEIVSLVRVPFAKLI